MKKSKVQHKTVSTQATIQKKNVKPKYDQSKTYENKKTIEDSPAPREEQAP